MRIFSLLLDPSNLPPTSAGVLYVVYTVAAVLGLPGLIALVRALAFLAGSAPALATVESPPESGLVRPGVEAAGMRYDISFALPDGTRQRTMLWLPSNRWNWLFPRQLSTKGLAIRYSRRDPTDARLTGQTVQTIATSLLLVAGAVGVVLAFR